ncbi:hypothetical protein GF342_04245 [Candidatus Woesearchaeota archaeon]|nr:hypothetical protein [Candidatus Woesearchaeota archaeon]
MGGRVRRALQRIVPYNTAISWSSALLTGIIAAPYFDWDALFNASSLDAGSVLRAFAPILAPCAAWALPRTTLSLADLILDNTKETSETTPHSELPSLPTVPTHKNYPLRTGLLTGAGYAGYVMLQGTDLSHALPPAILYATLSSSLIGCIRDRSLSTIHLSIAAGGLSYHAISSVTDPPANMLAALMAPCVSMYAGLGIALCRQRLSKEEKQQLAKFYVNPSEDKEEHLRVLGSSAAWIYSIGDLTHQRYENLFTTYTNYLEERPEHPAFFSFVLGGVTLFYRAMTWFSQILQPQQAMHEVAQAALAAYQRHDNEVPIRLERARLLAQATQHPQLHEIRVLESIVTGNWSESLTPLLEELPLEPLGASDHQVYRVSSTKGYLSSMFAIKTSTHHDELEQEKTTSERFNTTHEEHKVVTSLYLGRLADSERTAYVTRFAAGHTLDQSTNFADYIRVARYLGEIHQILESKRDDRDYRAVLEERLQTHPLGKELINEWDILWQHVNDKKVFDKDPHGKNWILTPDGSIVALDWHDKGRTNQCIQLAKLTEHSSIFGNNIDLRARVYRTYQEEFPVTDLDTLLQGTIACASPVAANSLYFHEQGRADTQLTKNYLNNATNVLRSAREQLHWTDPAYRRIEDIMHALAETFDPS